MKIGIFVWPEYGAYFPTFYLARQLVRRGHTVTFLGPVDFEDLCRRQGFDFYTLFRDSLAQDVADPPALPEGFWRFIRHIRRSAQNAVKNARNWEWQEALGSGELVTLSHDMQFELLLVDAFLQDLIPQLLRSGLPVKVFLHELSGSTYDIPPSTSSLVPQRSERFRWLSSMLAWSWCYVGFWLRLFVEKVVVQRLIQGGIHLEPRHIKRRRVEKLRHDVRSLGLRRRFWEYGWMYKTPDVYFCPRIFDFPPAHTKRIYLGACLDLERVESVFDFGSLPAECPLVYVSMGTHAAYYRGKTLPFLRKVFRAAEGLPNVQFIVAAGKGRMVDDIGPTPPNVVVKEFVPQLAVLKRASLVITNGGLGTVKECIWFGVPMIVVPCAYDQFGNAARVEFHQIGVMAHSRRISASELINLVLKCLGDGNLKKRIASMGEGFRSSTEFESTVIALLTQNSATPAHPSPN